MTAQTESRYWSMVDKKGQNDCWNWTGASSEYGHGMFRFDDKTGYAHRYGARLAGMDIDDVMVRHLCHNPGCQNPAHLTTGTQKDNMGDCVSADRHARGDRNGQAVFNDETVLLLRALYNTGDYSLRYLATGFGVSYEGMRKAINGKNWKHLEMYS